jgi:hypothetical protein
VFTDFWKGNEEEGERNYTDIWQTSVFNIVKGRKNDTILDSCINAFCTSDQLQMCTVIVMYVSYNKFDFCCIHLIFKC